MSFEKPTPLSDVDVAFPARVSHLMPPMAAIPDEFRMWNSKPNKWVEFQERWFYEGLKKVKMAPKEGIDPNVAIRHLKAIQGSFEPKHEHKVAAVAYLASLWFEDWSAE